MWFPSIERQHMRQSRNIAARAGRWSARHRRIAILGWMAFVVLAFMVGGKVGTEQLTTEQSGVGESGQADPDPRRGLPQGVGRDGPRLERQARVRRSRVPRGGRRRTRPPGADAGRRARSPIPTPRRPGTISDDGHAAMVAFEITGDSDSPEVAKIARDRERPDQGRPEGAPRADRRAVRRRHLGGGLQQDLREGPREGGHALAARHAGHPADRLRDARRRGDPAAAGHHRRRRARMGLVGPLSQISPVERVDQPRDPADRPGRRRGLRAVLPAPGARGARRRTQRRRRARGGRRDLGARRARLRHHGHDRDGRHVPRRLADVHLVRDRHDHRRRRGDAGLAHRAPRADVASSATASTRAASPGSPG